MKKKDKYLKIVEWSDEDNCYIGSIHAAMATMNKRSTNSFAKS